MPGVVEHGLFLTEADLVLLGRPDGGVERLER
jgi:ribose 5-phosphate isomerase